MNSSPSLRTLASHSSRQLVRRPGAHIARSRHASTKTTATRPSASGDGLPWESYFSYRKSRRTWGIAAAVPTTLGGVMLGGGYFANLQTEPGTLIFGIEPIWAYGIAVLGCVGAGWLSGPILGNGLWRLSHRSVLNQMSQMDTVFLNHIKRMRVDPSRQSVNNPVPDYYGEKIFSKKQYRQWLRDQNAYRRKAMFGEKAEGTAAL